MDYTSVLNDFAEGSTENISTDLAGNTRALTHAREQHAYWSWNARWRGGGPEFRTHCQDQAAFFAGWITRLERARDSLMSKAATGADPAHRYLH